jgi:WD40 repeat protein
MGRRAMEPVEVDFITAGRREEARVARRNLTIAAGVVAVLTILTGVSLFQWRRAEAQRVRALDIARVAVSQARLNADPTLAALFLLEVENPEETPYWAETARHAMNAGLSSGFSGAAALSALAFSPDGSMIVTGSDAGDIVRVRADGRGLPLAFGGRHDDQITSITYTPDGSRVVTGSRDGTVRVWDEAGDLVATLSGSGAQVSSISVSPDGLVAAGSREVRVWRADHSLARVFTEHEPSLVRSVAFGPGGERMASVAQNGTVRVWRADGVGETVVLEGHTAPVGAVAFSPDGDRIVTGSDDGTARVWSALESGPAQATLAGAPGPDGTVVVAVAFLPAGERVAVGYRDGSVWLWDADGGGGAPLGAHAAPLVSMEVSPDGTRLLTAARDGTARIWDLEGEGDHRALRQPTALTAAAFSPASGGGVVTASVGGSVALWHGRQRSDPTVLSRADGPLTAAAFSEDGAWIATVGERDFEYRAAVAPTDGGGSPDVVTLAEHFDPVRWARLSADGSHLSTLDEQEEGGTWALARGGTRVVAPGGGRTLARMSDPGATRFLTASGDTLRIVTSGPDGPDEIETLGLHPTVGSAGGGAFDGAGRRVVTTSRQDGSVMVWEGGRGRTLHAPEAAALQRALFAGFSPDGALIVAVSSDSVARVWNARTGARVATLRGHTGPITSASFSPDGRRIVTASMDSTARVWRADGSGDPVLLIDDRSSVLAAAFAADGRDVLTASANGVVHRWSTTTHARLAEALRRATNRCLDPPFRVQQLGEGRAVAEEAYAACEAGQGRSGPGG